MRFDREGTVRLVEGSGPHEGLVEIRFQGRWGTVCNNGWDLNDAMVVCHQLGYPTAVQAFDQSELGSGSGSGFNSIENAIIWLDNVGCMGFEANLTQCRSTNPLRQYCADNQQAGVKCSSKSEKLHFV